MVSANSAKNLDLIKILILTYFSPIKTGICFGLAILAHLIAAFQVKRVISDENGELQDDDKITMRKLSVLSASSTIVIVIIWSLTRFFMSELDEVSFLKLFIFLLALCILQLVIPLLTIHSNENLQKFIKNVIAMPNDVHIVNT